MALPLGAVTGVRELLNRGFSRSAVSRRVGTGELTPVRGARGIYLIRGRPASHHQDLVVISLYDPAVTFCLLTALQMHSLRAPAPDIWISIPNRAREPSIKHLPIRVIRPTARPKEADVESKSIDGVPLRVTCPAKTVADCFEYRTVVGVDVAIAALREARRLRLASMDDIWRHAEANSVSSIMLPYMEAIG